jgi:hypothetical protein
MRKTKKPANRFTTEPVSAPNRAAAILGAHFKFIEAKLAEGQALSSREVTFLQTAQSGGVPPSGAKTAKNQSELAAALGVTRKTIGRWQKIEGCPGGNADGSYEVQKWSLWAAVICRGGTSGEEDAGDDRMTLSDLKIRNLLLQNQKLEQGIAIVGKQWVPVETVKQWGGMLGANIRKVILTLHRRATVLVGLNLPETEAALKSFEDEVLSQLALLDDGVDDWQTSQVDPATL